MVLGFSCYVLVLGFILKGIGQLEPANLVYYSLREAEGPREEVATSRIGYQAYSDERLFEACVFGGDSNIAGEGDTCAAARGYAVDSRDYGLLHVSNPENHRMVFFSQMIS